MSIFRKTNDLESVSDKFNVQQEELIKYFKALGLDVNEQTEFSEQMTKSFDGYLNKKNSMLESIEFTEEETNDAAIQNLVTQGDVCYSDAQYQDAFDYFYLAYSNGNTYSAYMLGRTLENDFGYGVNYSKAVEYYVIASDNNIGGAQYRLAQCYRDGIGCQKDFLQAVQLFKLALKQGFNSPDDYANLDQCVQNMYKQQAERGDARGYFRLASYLVKKKGLEFDSPQVKEYVTLAAQHGDSSALYRMGLYAESENNDEQAKEYFIQAAKNGNNPAILRLKDKYDADVMDIISDNAAGLVSMGEYYGKKGDIAQSLEYYMKAADLNDAEAQYRIGSIYMKYPSYETDLDKNHIYWLKLSAEQGNANANYKLGVCYEGNDTIVEEDKALAFEYFEKAANNEQALAQSKLGFYYKRGVVVKQDFEMSYFWYLKGAENGHSIAQNQLAFCYMKGEGVEQDWEKAFYWFEKAAEQKHYVALYQLGLCYMYERGTAKDYQKARECFEKALDSGYEAAQKQLDVLNRIDTLNGNSTVEKLKDNFFSDVQNINIAADLERINTPRAETKSQVETLTPQIQTEATQPAVSINGNIDVDSLSEKQAIELMFKLQLRVNADVLNAVAAQKRLDELNKEEKLQEAKDLLAQTGFTAEQLELLKNYFNKE